MKIAINCCYGGFSLSEAAYERLIALGIPARKYVKPEPERDPVTKLFPKEESGECIYDRELDEAPEIPGMRALAGRYWDTWTRERYGRTHPLVLQVIAELGEDAGGHFAQLKVIEIPDDVEWEIEEYDGIEWIAEKHRTWRGDDDETES